MTIYNYSKELRNDIINFLIDVAVYEFGHKNWIDYLNNKDFTPYDNISSVFYLIKIDDKIIGTCGGLKVDEDTIKINSFYVDKNYRNNGIGNLLYNLIIKFSKNKYKKIILCTYKEYNIAYNMYKKKGFKIYKRDGEEIWMEKTI